MKAAGLTFKKECHLVSYLGGFRDKKDTVHVFGEASK